VRPRADQPLEYLEHYNEHRPHWSLGQRAPNLRKSSSIGPADRSDDTERAADLATSTTKQPELSTTASTSPGYVSLDAPTPPPHSPAPTVKTP
jgi:hypothetical protein